MYASEKISLIKPFQAEHMCLLSMNTIYFAFDLVAIGWVFFTTFLIKIPQTHSEQYFAILKPMAICT